MEWMWVRRCVVVVNEPDGWCCGCLSLFLWNMHLVIVDLGGKRFVPRRMGWELKWRDAGEAAGMSWAVGGRTLLARDWPGTSLSDARLDLLRFDCAFLASLLEGCHKKKLSLALAGNLFKVK
ncbi:hypothetical protein NPIL_564891 [Nephila pilipes]|uniref:Uncharacterized protein n=1 Tax=Nephila pilipes TaxID=299642 RepID=A0A8X6TQK5_NEPPI|nr:hypothetical protein NPIL_564891 [Nephila pilipes]